MVYGLIFLVVITSVAQNVCRKNFGKYCKSGLLFGGISSLVASLFYLFVTDFGTFSFEYIPLSLMLTVSFLIALIFMFNAISCGSFAITSLIFSYSVVIPFIYGVIFLNEKMTLWKLLGFSAFLISVFLISGIKIGKKGDFGNFKMKWIVFVVIGFVCNGLCAVFQKIQQNKFSGKYDNIGMLTAFVLSGIILIVLGFFIDNGEFEKAFTKGMPSAAICGISVGLTNMLALIAVSKMATSLFFSITSVGMMLMNVCLSLIVYKEKFTPMQIIGIVIGTLALVALNI